MFPSPLSHIVTHFGTPFKVRHTSRNPQCFCSTYIHTYYLYREVCLSSRWFLSGGFVRGFLFGRFFRGDFCLSPLLSAYIRYNRNLNITFNFRFRMYEKKLKSVTSHMLLDPSPCHKLSHLLGTPPPRLSRA